MQWRGLNLRTDPNDLPEEISPDSTNSAHYGGVLGKLGPRKGVTFFNTTAYADTVKGVVPFALPASGGRKLLVATTDGAITEYAAPLTSDQLGPTYLSTTVGGSYSSLALSTPILASITHASSTVAATSTFESSATIAVTTSTVIFLKCPKFTFTVTTPPGTPTNVYFTFGVLVSGTPSYMTNGYYFEMPDVATTVSLDTSAVTNGGNMLSIHPNDTIGAQTINGIAMKLTCSNWNSGQGTLSTTPFDRVLFR